MKIEKKIILASLLGGLTIVSAGWLVNSAGAYRGDYTQKGPNYNDERHKEMEKAFENNDYESWKNLMNNKGKATQVINEDNFSKFAEARKLALEGNYEEANQIRKELGLRTRNEQPAGENYQQGIKNMKGWGRIGK